jgi:hypothetical protein
MSIACLRRPPRPADQPTDSERGVLAASFPDCRIADARLAAEDDGTRYWLLPTSDGEAVWFVGLSAGGGRNDGGQTTFRHLAATGGAVTTSIQRGRWRYAVLVADGVERVRAGPVERRVDDNMVILDLADRAPRLELIGPAGTRILDLGPSDWDEFEASSPR